MAAVKAAAHPKRSARRDSESTPFKLPDFRLPQLATLRDKLPAGDSWLYEMKYDGYRAMAAVAGEQVRVFTRSGLDWSGKQFAYLVPAFSKLTEGSALIDGEICAIDADGRSDFSLLKTSLDGKSPIVFFAFDLLEQDGADIAALPQLERKERLERLLGSQTKGSPIIYSPHVQGGGKAVLGAMCEGGFEGVIAKSPTARYYSDRSETWLKIKCVKRQEFVIIGWRPPDYGDSDIRGLFLGTYEDGKLVYRGGVGTGLNDRQRREYRQLLGRIERPVRPPVVGMPKPEMRVARWVEPQLLAEVQYTEITPDGVVRHPSFKGLREDKNAADVRLEEEA
jgi:bifunctional non-homologous end joining protein LigD